jgi:hypothetical protein
MIVQEEKPVTGKLAEEPVPAVERWSSVRRRTGKANDERVGNTRRVPQHISDIDFGRESPLIRELSRFRVVAVTKAHRGAASGHEFK